MHPSRLPAMAGLADPSLDQPRQQQQLLRVPSLRNSASPSHKIVSRTAVGPASAGLCPTAVGPAPSGLSPTAASLPYSCSAALGAAGLRPAVVLLDLDQHTPHGVQKKTPGFPLSSAGLRCSAFSPEKFRAPREPPLSRTPLTLWYQTSKVTSVFVE